MAGLARSAAMTYLTACACASNSKHRRGCFLLQTARDMIWWRAVSRQRGGRKLVETVVAACFLSL
jgi:hypothetical protein